MPTSPGLSDSVKLLKNFRTTGTFTRSSRALIDTMLAGVDFSTARCIVELGSGTGCITQELLQRMRTDATLICLELNAGFAAHLAQFADERLQVHNVCASALNTVLAAHNIDNVDYVISSLPLALIERSQVARILHAAQQCLCAQGKFLQCQYGLTQYRRVKQVFATVQLRFTLRNVPPAFVYECAGVVGPST